MSTTPINATLAQTERDAVLQAISTIKEKLPFLVDRTYATVTSDGAAAPYRAPNN
ncbi:hypothetical protein [Nostoc sp.]|uniref:hypothetical protein n=1 Tax=Nostoc sp. TaxID=1180 RepID=UPI002FFAEEB2